MPVPSALVLAAHLNACRHSPLSAEVAARAVVGEHTAHHVIDADGLLGLDPLAASELDRGIAAALLLVDSDWVVALPRPGRLAPLTGPPALTTRALEAGAVVLPVSGGPAWIPHLVGPAIQWTLARANPPRLTMTAADADRQLRDVVLRAERRLADLPFRAGDPPEHEPAPALPGAYAQRLQHLLDRAWRLRQAAAAALADDGNAVHLHAITARRDVLSELRDAADEALAAAVSWPIGPPD